MERKRAFDFGPKAIGTYEEPTICPLCKHALKPTEKAFFTYQNNDGDWRLSFLYLCEVGIMPFSRSGLIEQLEHDGFTNKQAVYGVEQNGY